MYCPVFFIVNRILYITVQRVSKRKIFFLSGHLNLTFLGVYWPGIPCYWKISWRTWRILRRRSTLSSSPPYTASTWRTLSRLSFFYRARFFIEKSFPQKICLPQLLGIVSVPKNLHVYFCIVRGKQMGSKYQKGFKTFQLMLNF